MRVLLIHGYKSQADAGWLKRLHDDLIARGAEVAVVAPGKEIAWDVWRESLRGGLVASPDVVVAHSLGAYALLKALGESRAKMRKVLLVAGFAREYSSPVIDHLKNKFVAWFDAEIPFEDVRRRAAEWRVFHSDDDEIVPLEEGKWLAERLGAQLQILHLRHLGDEQGEIEVPEVLKEIWS